MQEITEVKVDESTAIWYPDKNCNFPDGSKNTRREREREREMKKLAMFAPRAERSCGVTPARRLALRGRAFLLDRNGEEEEDGC
jgi:hypothetical protein